jgi:hypothetical protein
MTVSDALQGILRERREWFNQRFAREQWEHPNLSPEGFKALLGRVLDPLTSALARGNDGDALPKAVQTLYDRLLNLYARNLVGEKRPGEWIQRCWETLLPDLAPQILQDPGRVTAACCNAIHNLSRTPGGDPEAWLQSMRALGTTLPDADTLLQAGQVLGWRCGLAQYRLSALERAPSLPKAALRPIFSLPPEVSPDAALAEMRKDPWWTPDDGMARAPAIRGRVGGFTGFEGPFRTPPLVCSYEGQLIAWDREDTWLLFADAWGRVLLPSGIGSEELTPTTDIAQLPAPETLKINGKTLRVPGLHRISSATALPHTLAITQPLSHRILLIRL